MRFARVGDTALRSPSVAFRLLRALMCSNKKWKPLYARLHQGERTETYDALYSTQSRRIVQVPEKRDVVWRHFTGV